MSELDRLRQDASTCTKCALSDTRTQVVFGVGNPDADLIFVGEAPGRSEDLEGEPFVGRAGQLLNTLLGEIGIERADVYIANILKCRPPGNRDPHPIEVQTCTSYLDRQIELIRPHVVVTLGNFATKYLLSTEIGITRLRGRRFRFRDAAALIPTFHPAAVLRGGSNKLDDMRHDFKVIRRSIDSAKAQTEQAQEPVAANPGHVDIDIRTSREREESTGAPYRVAAQSQNSDDDQLELF